MHRAVDSSDPDTFAVLLRRGGAAALVDVDHVVGRGGMGCDPWSEDTSMMALFKRCILRSAIKRPTNKLPTLCFYQGIVALSGTSCNG